MEYYALTWETFASLLHLSLNKLELNDSIKNLFEMFTPPLAM